MNPDISQNLSAPTPVPDAPSRGRVRIIGVGNAGGAMLAALRAEDLPGASILVVNSDATALANLPYPDKLHISPKLLSGHGSRSEPGKAELDAQVDALRPLCAGADVVAIVAGLGGRAGTQLSCAAARAAREAGALVLAFVTLPFDCEGSVRFSQARQGLDRLRAAANLVGCVPHQAVAAHLDETTSLKDAYTTAGQLSGAGLRAVLFAQSATTLMGMAFADLCALVQDRHSETVFAVAEAAGEQRVAEVVRQLLAHPLMRGGQALAEAGSVSVSVVGGSDLRMAEVNQVMQQLARQGRGAPQVMGAGICPALGERLAVVLLTAQPRNSDRPETASEEKTRVDVESDAGTFDEHLHLRADGRRPRTSVESSPGGDALTGTSGRAGNSRTRRSTARLRQGQLPLDLVSKGRFDKSEPTVHKGEDLDVPTFIRRGIALN